MKILRMPEEKEIAKIYKFSAELGLNPVLLEPMHAITRVP
jgi:hypothetical protein